MTDNKPILTTRDRTLSVSIFKKQATGNDGQEHTFYSACLQRSYKDKNGEWQRESINIYPDELLKVSALTMRAYNQLSLALQQEKEIAQASGKEYPAQQMDELNDFVPF